MAKHGTASDMTPGQFATIAARVITALPKALRQLINGNLPVKEIIAMTGEGERLANALRDSLRMLYYGHPRADGVSDSYYPVRNVLGADFITAEEIATRTSFDYSEAHLQHLRYSLPELNIISWLGDRGYLLVAGPPRPLSLLEILHHVGMEDPDTWYCKPQEGFTLADKVAPGWLMFRKTPVRGSTGKRYEEQIRRLAPAEYLPNVAEAVWAIVVYLRVRGMRLFPDMYVSTSSRPSRYTESVSVGVVDSDGVSVTVFDDVGSDVVGLAAARRPGSDD
jgi:hypothetical protein